MNQLSTAQLNSAEPTSSREKLTHSDSDAGRDDKFGTAQLKAAIRTYIRASKRKGDDNDSTQLSQSMTKEIKTKKFSSDSA